MKGCAPRWQFCHVDDLVSALEFTVGGGIDGDFAVGCDGWLEQDEVEQLSGLKSIEPPARLTFGTAQRLHRVGVTPRGRSTCGTWCTPGWWTAPPSAAGGRPGFANQEVLRALLDQRRAWTALAGRRIARKEATITATAGDGRRRRHAAIVRRARRRRPRLSHQLNSSGERAKRARCPPPSEPKGRGAAWTEERGTSDERRRHLGAWEAARRRVANTVRLIAVRESELSVNEVRAAVADPAAGGIALFAGAVRDSDHDRGITGLSYSAAPIGGR